MKGVFHKTMRLLKRVQKIQEDLKKGNEVEKFSLPDTEELEEKALPVQRVDLSTSSVVKSTFAIMAILVFAWFLFSVQDLIIIFFISLFFAAALDPAVDWLESKKFPRALGVVLIYVVLLTVVIAIIGSMVPIIIQQITTLINNFADSITLFFQNIKQGEGLEFLPEIYRNWVITTLSSMDLEFVAKEGIANLANFQEQIQKFASGSLKTIGSTVEVGVNVASSLAVGLFNFILVLFLTFFMAVDRGNLNDFFHSLFPKRYGSYISTKTAAIQKQIGAWMRGQLLLSVIMFVTTFIGLIIIGMGDYALTLALVMAIGEFIPYVGPLIFLLFALPVAFGISFAVVVKLLIFYVVLQFVEGNVFVPVVMKKAVGLSPIVVLLVLIIGWQFLGIIGAIIAVPVTTAVVIFLSDYMKSMAKK